MRKIKNGAEGGGRTRMPEGTAPQDYIGLELKLPLSLNMLKIKLMKGPCFLSCNYEHTSRARYSLHTIVNPIDKK